ncbi:hypothetical protein CEXT_588611 [Caerostris extrusa]|uniref:Uncharacterized protein n=1 Tax=Caerostris extrusa TaxID=172846 RepID=A0AAV4XVM6_CAEEX|nr:hypothetical protein CEXT_588611 [Caerostris extrusa]
MQINGTELDESNPCLRKRRVCCSASNDISKEWIRNIWFHSELHEKREQGACATDCSPPHCCRKDNPCTINCSVNTVDDILPVSPFHKFHPRCRIKGLTQKIAIPVTENKSITAPFSFESNEKSFELNEKHDQTCPEDETDLMNDARDSGGSKGMSCPVSCSRNLDKGDQKLAGTDRGD